MDAADQLAAEESISGKEALDEITERVRSCISKQKERIRKEREDRSAEIDRQAIMKCLTQRVQEESGDFENLYKFRTGIDIPTF